MHSSLNRSQHATLGFTLIEVVISFALLSVVVSIAYSTMSGLMRAKQYLDDGRDAQAVANAVIQRITRELQLADQNNGLLPSPQNKNVRYPRNANMLGSATKDNSEEAKDEITFMAHGASQYVLGNSEYADIVQITYRVEEDPEQRGGAEPTYYLVRDETPLIRPYDKAFERRVTFPITSRLVALDFRYLKLDDNTGDRWLDEWGPPDNPGLPAMVEFTFKIRSNMGQITSFTSAVPLRHN